MTNKNPKQQILSKLTELFISKSRKLDEITADVWINQLLNRYPLKELIRGIDKMIYANDDFPSVSKIGAFTEDEMKWSEILNETDRVLLEDKKKLQLEDMS